MARKSAIKNLDASPSVRYGSSGSKLAGPQTRRRRQIYPQELTFWTSLPYGEFVPLADSCAAANCQRVTLQLATARTESLAH
jgi:hypothetical protein